MKTLHLPLKAKWYEMIESLIKGDEYRGITSYWIQRLCVFSDGNRINKSETEFLENNKTFLYSGIYEGNIEFIKFTHVKFSYGYTKRTMTFEIESITIGKGKPEWGAPTEDVFIIKLGKRNENK